MKRKLIIVLGLSILVQFAFAQKSKDTKAEDDKKYFDASDEDFNTTSVPEKWKDESAVILCQKLTFSYNFKGQLNTVTYHIEESVRKRIKLQDKAAIEEFSKFYFLTSAKVGIHIVKPDGKIVDVDVTQAIEEESKIPSIYRSFTISEKYKKLAIPGLEIGDILDYYYSTIDISAGRDGETRAFTPFIFTLNASYPINKQILFFNVDKIFFLNFNATNGAPEIVAGDAGTNYKGDVKETIKTYILKDTDREKLADEKWDYPYRNYPTIKFQVVTGTKNSYKESEFFLGVRGEPKTTVTKQELVLSMSRRFLNETALEKFFKSYTVPFIVDYIKKKHKGVTDPEILMKEAYYCLRYQYPSILGSSPFFWTDTKNEFLSNNTRIIDELFCEVMNGVAKKLKLKLEVFIVIPRSIGDFEKVLMPGELNIGVRVNNSLLLSPPRFYSVHSTIDPSIEGCDAIVFIPEDDAEKSTFSEIKLSNSSPKDNQISYSVTAAIDESLELVDIVRTTGYKGHYIENAPIYAAYEDDVVYEDKKKFDVDFKEEAEDKMSKKEKEEKAVKDQEKSEYLEKVKEYLKENTDGEFEIQDYFSFEVKNLGREPESNEFTFDEHFNIKNMINKAGKNYTLNFGLLLGEQTEISEKERLRVSDIDIAFAKSIVSEITLKIPEGYTLDGLDDLNINIDNTSMAFKSVAKFENNILKVNVTKEYKLNHDNKSNWKNWVEVVDGAYNYTQKKIVKKK